MAVAPTGLIFKTLQFDGQSSGEYGVYITGQAVYNAPARDIEMVSIPGRNGSFALDHGRFENIEVTYPAGIFADNEADFAQAVSDFRNYLCSRNGYVRLTDDYNPEEYRMAIYKSGLEVSPAQLKAGEFEITFDCKPQRWLMSGEAAIEVESGTTLLNPTMFDASPLLEVEGYGTIEFNGYEITIDDMPIGNVVLVNSGTLPDNKSATYDVANYNLLNVGDEITLQAGTTITTGISPNAISDLVTSLSMTVASSDVTCHIANYSTVFRGRTAQVIIDEPISFAKGTWPTKAIVINLSASYTESGVSKTYTGTLTLNINFNQVRVWITDDLQPSLPGALSQLSPTGTSQIGEVVGNSTKPLTGDAPIMIDLDLGEAYMITDSGAVSLNKYIDLGSDLPKFAVGGNEITFDNTITELKVRPRWWKV